MTTLLLFEGPSLLFSATEEIPTEEMPEERPARLLEAGTYPDKGLTLTESDLDEIAARFSANASAETLPVKVEHTDSPLDPLGRVVRVWREGAALLGTLAFPADLAGFLRRRGAAKLSVGLSRAPLTLREVSLVLKPRIATATLMGEEAASKEPNPPAPFPAREGGVQQEIVRLRAELAAREVDTQITAFKAQGRILPAAEGAARALFALGDMTAVTLAHGLEPVSVIFRRFLEAMPPAMVFGEMVLGASEAGINGFTHYEHMFLSKHLGVDPAKVAALIQQEKLEKEEGKHYAR